MEIGTRLGCYEILSELGSGGMGKVYQAKDLKLGEFALAGQLNVLENEASSAEDITWRKSPRLPSFQLQAVDGSRISHLKIDYFVCVRVLVPSDLTMQLGHPFARQNAVAENTPEQCRIQGQNDDEAFFGPAIDADGESRFSFSPKLAVPVAETSTKWAQLVPFGV